MVLEQIMIERVSQAVVTVYLGQWHSRLSQGIYDDIRRHFLYLLLIYESQHFNMLKRVRYDIFSTSLFERIIISMLIITKLKKKILMKVSLWHVRTYFDGMTHINRNDITSIKLQWMLKTFYLWKAPLFTVA